MMRRLLPLAEAWQYERIVQRHASLPAAESQGEALFTS